MPTPTEEPLTKVTLNLFTKDVEYLRRWGDYTVGIRNIVHREVARLREAEDTYYGQ